MHFSLTYLGPHLHVALFLIDVMAIPLPSINVNVSLAAQRFLFPKHIVGLYSWVNIAAIISSKKNCIEIVSTVSIREKQSECAWFPAILKGLASDKQ